MTRIGKILLSALLILSLSVRVIGATKQFGFTGAWLPSVDPLKIGPENFKTLQNMRYNDVGIIGVQGFTKLNSTITGETGFRTGYQLRTDRTIPSIYYVSTSDGNVYENRSTIPNTGDFEDPSIELISNGGFDSGTTDWSGSGASLSVAGSGQSGNCLTVTRSSGDTQSAYQETGLSVIPGRDYVLTAYVKSGTSGNETFVIEATSSSKAVSYGSTTGTSSASWVQYTLNFTALSSGIEIYLTKSSDTAGTMLFDTVSLKLYDAIHDAATGAGLGRFSEYPRGSIGYSNGKESMVTSGPESETAGFFTVDDIAVSDRRVQFVNDGESDYIYVNNDNFWAEQGFMPGISITVTGASETGNNGDWIIDSFSNDGQNLHVDDGLTDETTSDATIVSDDIIPVNPIDYTDAANNVLDTEGNVIPIGNANDEFTVLLLHMDGEDGETSFVDSSTSGHTVAISGGDTPYTTTDYAKFGDSSTCLGGESESYIYVADSDDFHIFDSDDFTIDFWINLQSEPDDLLGIEGHYYMYRQYEDADNYIEIALIGQTNIPSFEPYTTYSIRVNIGGTLSQVGFTTSEPWTDWFYKWRHVAVVKSYDSGHYFKIYIDGNYIGKTWGFSSATTKNYTGNIQIGGAGPIDDGLNAYVDEYRVSKGIARWTSDFTPPSRPYKDFASTVTGSNKWYVLSTRPIQGVNYYLSQANTIASTLTCKTWNGRTFSNMTVHDGTANYDGTISMYQDGYVAVDIGDEPKPAHVTGLYLYTYLFELSAGGCEIYNTSIDTGFSDVVDVWDGVYRQPIKFITDYSKHSSGSDSPIDYTADIAEVDGSFAHIGGLYSSEAIYVAFEERVNSINISMMKCLENWSKVTMSVYYWAGEDWVKCQNLIDTTRTKKGESLGQSGTVTWASPSSSEEQLKTEFGVTGYFYQIKFSNSISGNEVWDDDDWYKYVGINKVDGVPIPQKMKQFSFPSLFKDRALLCGYTEGKEGNRVDYSMSNAPDVWNGEETSMGGIQSLYFGGSNELMAGTQLYNKLGSNMFASWLALKDSETYLLIGDGPEDFRIFPINMNIGCPAPLSLATATFEAEQGLNRNVAMWVSYSGPVMFDLTVVRRMKGLEKYFDPSNSDYIKPSLIQRTIGWYDKTNNEYNISIPTGTSPTDNTLWVAYDLDRKKWFEKVPSVYPQVSIPVVDENGFSYNYAGANGYMYRLEDGDDWDGTAISHVWETGDFFLSENLWMDTQMTEIKVAMKRTSEDTDLYITHYKDTEEDDKTWTWTDITFTSPDTISSAAGNFNTQGIYPGQAIEISGTDSNDTSGTPVIVESVSPGGETLTVASGITTEASGDTVVFTVDYDLKIAIDAGSERIMRSTDYLVRDGWSHRLKFEVDSGGSGATEKDIQPHIWAVKYNELWEDR